jgi:hypothetical protein
MEKLDKIQDAAEDLASWRDIWRTRYEVLCAKHDRLKVTECGYRILCIVLLALLLASWGTFAYYQATNAGTSVALPFPWAVVI